VTEAEWRKERGNAQWLMHHLRSRRLPRTKAGRRKLRLFACGCCRLTWDQLPDARLREAVLVAERFAEGQASKDELAAARGTVAWLTDDSVHRAGTPLGVRVAIDMAVATTHGQPFEAAFYMTATTLPLAGSRGRERAGEAALCDRVRCVFGNPFRPVAVDPARLAWSDGCVPKLARVIYDDRRFEDLPVLADALEEAGCTDKQILSHSRGPGPHVRGCWVVDLYAPGGSRP
jgi:hypothetical protein